METYEFKIVIDKKDAEYLRRVLKTSFLKLKDEKDKLSFSSKQKECYVFLERMINQLDNFIISNN